MTSLIRFNGVVQAFPAKRTDTFKLLCVGSNNLIVFKGEPFIVNNLQEDDRISFEGILTTPNTGLMVNKPIVLPIDDEEGLKKCFIKALKKSGRFGDVRSKNLYNTLYYKARTANHDNIITYLDDFVQNESITNFSNVTSICDESGKDILDANQARDLYKWWLKYRLYRPLYIIGFTNKDIKNTHMPVDKILEICKTNPLKLLNLDFDKCKAICDYYGITLTDEQVREGYIARHFRAKLINDGDTSISIEKALETFEDLPDHMENLKNDYGMKMEHNSLYLPFPYICESYIANRLLKLYNMKNKIKLEDIKQKEIQNPNDPISKYTSSINRKLDETQLKAVVNSINSTVSVIKGRAGTGKSTVIKELIDQLKNMNVRWVATSFTGKAVERLRYIVGRGCFKTKEGKDIGFINTMHKMIFNSKSFIDYEFEYLIIDEASMVSNELLYLFLKTFKHNYNIVFVGDTNQLQPIDWGIPFYNIIKSGIFPISELTKNYRITVNGEMDSIIKNANKIIDYNYDAEDRALAPFYLEEGANFKFQNAEMDKVFDIIRAFYNQNYDYKQVTIICPYNKYQNDLNLGCQKIYHENKRLYLQDNNGLYWFPGDRISCRKNINGVAFNGEEGIIVDMHLDNEYEKSYVTVKFNNNPEEYDFYFSLKTEDDKKDVDEDDESLDENPEKQTKLLTRYLRHSYALTTHLSQGSEWDYVILYIPPINTRVYDGGFLNKNLCYTSITRAKRGLFIIGDIDNFRLACMCKPKDKHDNLDLWFTPDKVHNLRIENIEKDQIDIINKVTDYIQKLNL